MKRILVTGGAGFVGSHLCEALLKKNYFVICLDDLSTGSLENIRHLQKDPNFQFQQHDVTIPIQVTADEIYSLACPASPKSYQSRPVETAKTSVLGSINMLELARQNQARILLASTSEVYGDPEVHPQPETYYGHVNVMGPRSCYDESKRCAETFFYDYRRQYGVKTKVARIFNTYGPRMQLNDGRVVSNFIVQALQNKKISIYGDGTQTRSFCYVSDLVDGLIQFMEYSDDFAGPLNMGSENEIAMKELAMKVMAIAQKKTELIFEALPSDDPRRRKPDLRLIQEKLGWTASTSLDEGLRKTVEFFKTQL